MRDNEVHDGNVRQFRGLWIPVEVLQDDRLTLTDKVLWADINSYTSPTMSYFKARETIAEHLQVSERSVTRSLKNLIATGWVAVIANDGRKRHFHAMQPRQCVSAQATEWLVSQDKMAPEPSQSVPRSSTVREQVRTQERMSAPTMDAVREYFENQGGTEPDAFYDYFASQGWKRKNGQDIVDWKAAARNWMRNEHKFKKDRRGFNPEGFTPDGISDFIAHG
jgi:hypothetical protein